MLTYSTKHAAKIIALECRIFANHPAIQDAFDGFRFAPDQPVDWSGDFMFTENDLKELRRTVRRELATTEGM